MLGNSRRARYHIRALPGWSGSTGQGPGLVQESDSVEGHARISSAQKSSMETMTRFLLGLTAGLLVGASLSACSHGVRKLDEAMFYEGPEFRLKLVRYHENLPLHYNGEVFRVQCASRNTRHSQAQRMQEEGWVSLQSGGAIGSSHAAELAERERRNYTVIDDRTLVWIGNGLSVSFDACGSVRHWSPTSLPADFVIPAAKPEYCRPVGNVDCRHLDFLDDRLPRFEEIQVTTPGGISFVMRSKALRDGMSVRVRSVDFGETWRMTPS